MIEVKYSITVVAPFRAYKSPRIGSSFLRYNSGTPLKILRPYCSNRILNTSEGVLLGSFKSRIPLDSSMTLEKPPSDNACKYLLRAYSTMLSSLRYFCGRVLYIFSPKVLSFNVLDIYYTSYSLPPITFKVSVPKVIILLSLSGAIMSLSGAITLKDSTPAKVSLT